MDPFSNLISFIQSTSREINVPAYYENNIDCFNSKWNNHNITSQPIQNLISSSGILSISNDPDSIGTPLFDLNIERSQQNSVYGSDLYVTDFCSSLCVSENPIYRNLGFREDFVICFYLAYQRQAIGTFQGAPKLKELLLMYDNNGSPVPLSANTPFNTIDNKNVLPIMKIELRNKPGTCVFPSISKAITSNFVGNFMGYKVNQNNNSYPICGGLYMFATKFQTIIAQPSQKNLKQTMTPEIREAIQKVLEYQELIREKEQREKSKINTPYRKEITYGKSRLDLLDNQQQQQQQIPLMEEEEEDDNGDYYDDGYNNTYGDYDNDYEETYTNKEGYYHENNQDVSNSSSYSRSNHSHLKLQQSFLNETKMLCFTNSVIIKY